MLPPSRELDFFEHMIVEGVDITRTLYLHLNNRLTPGLVVNHSDVEVEYPAIILDAAKLYIPTHPTYEWYLDLKQNGPGQNDPLFKWLAEEATLEEFRWFLTQECAGEVGFGDLVAMTLVGMPHRAKLEMARNFWDEMGQGKEAGMHDVLLRNLAKSLDCHSNPDLLCIEPLILSNFMGLLSLNRQFAFCSVGALGVIEMTAPGRVTKVDECLTRLGISKELRLYFKLHGTLDVKHSEEWNKEVMEPMWKDHGYEMALGAWSRLYLGSLCFEAYRKHLWNTPAQ